MAKPPDRYMVPACVAALLLAGLYFWVLNPDVVGMLYDDGMYFLSATSLAHGSGYRLTHIAGDPLFYKYPPLFPGFLAALDRLTHNLPHPAFWLKLGNVLLSFAALALLYRLLRRTQKLPGVYALGIVLLLATQWPYVEVSVELMSEPLFLLLVFWVLERASQFLGEGKNLDWRNLTPLILGSALCFYTRTMGIVLIAAVAAWLWISENRKTAVTYAAAIGTLCFPWFLWSGQRTDATQFIGDFLVRSFQETYGQSFLMDTRYEATPWALYAKGVETLLGNFSTYFFRCLPPVSQAKNPLLVLIILLAALALLVPLLKYTSRQLQQKKFSLTGIYTALYLTILPFWGYFTIYPRFMLAVLPFLMAALCHATLEAPFSERSKKILIGGAITVALACNLSSLSPYLHKPYRNTVYLGTKVDVWQEYQSAFAFINGKTPPGSVLASDNTDEAYLYASNTNRQTADFFLFLPKAKLEDFRAAYGPKDAVSCLLLAQADATYQALQTAHVHYFIAHRFQKTYTRHIIAKVLPTTPLLLQRYPNAFKPVMRSPRGFITIYRFTPTH